MNTFNFNQKRKSVAVKCSLMMMSAMMVALTTLTACVKDDENDDENANEQWAITFTGTTSDGIVYSLKVGEKSVKSNDTPQQGDAYELNVKSKGAVDT